LDQRPVLGCNRTLGLLTGQRRADRRIFAAPTGGGTPAHVPIGAGASTWPSSLMLSNPASAGAGAGRGQILAARRSRVKRLAPPRTSTMASAHTTAPIAMAMGRVTSSSPVD
jgi:hypothetical protein